MNGASGNGMHPDTHTTVLAPEGSLGWPYISPLKSVVLVCCVTKLDFWDALQVLSWNMPRSKGENWKYMTDFGRICSLCNLPFIFSYIFTDSRRVPRSRCLGFRFFILFSRFDSEIRNFKLIFGGIFIFQLSRGNLSINVEGKVTMISDFDLFEFLYTHIPTALKRSTS